MTSPLVSLKNEIWGTNIEIPHWRCITIHIWVVLLIGWKFASSNQNHYPDLGSSSDMSSVWNFYARSSDAVADPDLQISGGPSLKIFFWHFGPQFGRKKGGMAGGQAPGPSPGSPLRCHFLGKSGDAVKCWLFSQDSIFYKISFKKDPNFAQEWPTSVLS